MMTELVWEVGIPIIRKVTATWDVTKDLLVRRITGDVRLRPQIRVEFAVSVIFRLPAVDELPQHGNHRVTDASIPPPRKIRVWASPTNLNLECAGGFWVKPPLDLPLHVRYRYN